MVLFIHKAEAVPLGISKMLPGPGPAGGGYALAGGGPGYGCPATGSVVTVVVSLI
ncbi:hypothetical protein [Methanothrix sp.]|uniref:hypothetical protein n=1 Tax=Methanothrix sp. TaxID=90426 RepID=UPI0025F60E68|nr:hypothetical protein [Methanothrix sp.]